MTLNGTETRWHLSGNTPPDYSVAPGNQWTDTTNLYRRKLLLANQDGATADPITSYGITTVAGQNYGNILMLQFVSSSLPGNVRLQQRLVSAVMFMQVVGGTPQVNVIAGIYIFRPSTGQRFGCTTYGDANTLYNYGANSGSGFESRVITNDGGSRPAGDVTQVGDRMVLEVGCAPYAPASVYFTMGTVSGGPANDVPYGTGYTNNLSPWVAIDQDLYQSRSLNSARQFFGGSQGMGML